MNKNKLARKRESQYIRNLRFKMWVKDPFCKYCGVETIQYDSDLIKKGEPVPPHVATIDHKYSRYNPERDRADQEYILCCNLCNNYRAQLEEMKIPLEELRKRSQGGVRRGDRIRRDDKKPPINPEIPEIIKFE